VVYEDYMLHVMSKTGLNTSAPYGFAEITPECEYLLVAEFIDGAHELLDGEVDDVIIDDALATIRTLWDSGLAHRDIKPSNLLVRDGKVYLIDVAFARIRPTPWRQAAARPSTSIMDLSRRHAYVRSEPTRGGSSLRPRGRTGLVPKRCVAPVRARRDGEHGYAAGPGSPVRPKRFASALLGIPPTRLELSGLEVKDGSSRVILDSDRAGLEAAEVTLTEKSDVSAATEVPSDEVDTQRFERIDTLRNRYSGVRYYLFDGGCATYRFDFSEEGRTALAEEITVALGFQSRKDVNSALKEDAGLELWVLRLV
jgi:serine/threonine protein kinase